MTPLLVALTLASAKPEPMRVAVLPIIIAPEKQLTASQVFKQITDAAQLRPTLRVMSIDDYYFHDGGDLANRALACGADTECIAAQLRPFAAQLGVVVIANLELDPPLVSVLLLDTDTRKTLGDRAVEADARAVPRKILTETSQLFDAAGHPRSGRIAVKVEPGRASIAIEDLDVKPDIGESNVFTLPPGEYQVLASAEGFQPGRTTARVTSGETSTVELTLVEETSILQSPWFWIVGSAVVVAAGATATAFALSRSERCICVITQDMRKCTVCQ